jgi:hypothetical protein
LAYVWTGVIGNWSLPSNWKTIPPIGGNSYPGEVGTTDAVSIPSIGTGALPITVTYDVSAAIIGSLSISGSYDVLDLSGSGNALTVDVTSNVFGASAVLNGSNNQLTMSGSHQTLTFNLETAGLQLYLTSQTAGAGDVLAVGGATNALDVNGTGNGIVYLAAGGSLTLAGGSFNVSGATLRVEQGASISGFGAINTDGITYSSSAGGAITASGGDLRVSVSSGHSINYQIQLGIDNQAGGDLIISGSATPAHAIVMDNANQTLELASDGAVNIGELQSVTGGTIKLDGGAALLEDLHGLDLGAGSDLTGAGTVQVGTGSISSFNGAGTVTAKFLGSSYTLTFNGRVDQSGSATSFNIDSGATLAFQGMVGTNSISPTIDFSTSGAAIAKLDLSAAAGAGFYGVVQNFYNLGLGIGSDQILVGGSSTGNNLLVTDVNGTVYTGGVDTAFKYVSVMNSGTLVDRINMGSHINAVNVGFLSSTERTTLVTTETICFMAGTMIRTPDGEVAVETLKRGDLVLTSDGLAQPVCWLGRQTVSTRFADPLRVLPVRIKAGALAENVPGRDLLLSPDHAVLVDGALIHAGALVNEVSILRETAVPEIFTYYHVELDDHSLVLAENTPAETFVDNVERLAFDNWAEHEALYPEGKSIAELPYPRAKGRRQVPVYVRVLLAERAAIIGAANPAAMVA